MDLMLKRVFLFCFSLGSQRSHTQLWLVSTLPFKEIEQFELSDNDQLSGTKPRKD